MNGIDQILLEAEAKISRLSGKKVKLRLMFFDNEIADFVMPMVCREFGIHRSDLKGTSREARYVAARRAYCWLAYKYISDDYKVIARLLGKDRTTVLHHVETANHFMYQNDPEKHRILKIENQIIDKL